MVEVGCKGWIDSKLPVTWPKLLKSPLNRFLGLVARMVLERPSKGESLVPTLVPTILGDRK
jgi:hypothetical protein